MLANLRYEEVLQHRIQRSVAEVYSAITVDTLVISVFKRLFGCWIVSPGSLKCLSGFMVDARVRVCGVLPEVLVFCCKF